MNGLGINSFSILNDPQVTPEMFGAIGDGLVDDSTALEEAFNSGKIIVLDANKIYCITRSITVTTDAEILGKGAIIQSDSSPSFTFQNTPMINFLCNFKISDLTLDGKNNFNKGLSAGTTNTDTTIYDHAVIENCTVKNFTNTNTTIRSAEGISIPNIFRTTIVRNSHVSNIYAAYQISGSQGASGIAITGTYDNLLIDNNMIQNVTSADRYDADGIKIFKRYEGESKLNATCSNNKLFNCSGRFIKLLTSAKIMNNIGVLSDIEINPNFYFCDFQSDGGIFCNNEWIISNVTGGGSKGMVGVAIRDTYQTPTVISNNKCIGKTNYFVISNDTYITTSSGPTSYMNVENNIIDCSSFLRVGYTKSNIKIICTGNNTSGVMVNQIADTNSLDIIMLNNNSSSSDNYSSFTSISFEAQYVGEQRPTISQSIEQLCEYIVNQSALQYVGALIIPQNSTIPFIATKSNTGVHVTTFYFGDLYQGTYSTTTSTFALNINLHVDYPTKGYMFTPDFSQSTNLTWKQIGQQLIEYFNSKGLGTTVGSTRNYTNDYASYYVSKMSSNNVVGVLVTKDKFYSLSYIKSTSTYTCYSILLSSE